MDTPIYNREKSAEYKIDIWTFVKTFLRNKKSTGMTLAAINPFL